MKKFEKIVTWIQEEVGKNGFRGEASFGTGII